MPYLTRPTPDPEPIDCKVLTAALNLFVEHGYHKVSIHEIQKASDVSIGSIYKYFEGKEGVATALYKHILGEIEELVDTVILKHTSAHAQCEALITALFKHTETHPDIIAYAFHAKHSEFLSDLPSICDSKPFLKMRTMVQKGMNEGEFIEMDPWVATTALFGGVSRMIQLRLDGMLDKPLPEYTQQVFASIWGGLSTRPEKAPSHQAIPNAVPTGRAQAIHKDALTKL